MSYFHSFPAKNTLFSLLQLYACIGFAVVGLHSFLTKTVFICSVTLVLAWPLLVCIVFLRKLRIEEIQYNIMLQTASANVLLSSLYFSKFKNIC